MRNSRLHKYRNKHKKLILLIQLTFIWYATTISVSTLTSGTAAYFSNTKQTGTIVQAGTWWDGSILYFTGIPTQNVKACASTEINVGVKNDGNDMIGPTTYEVFYSEKGNGNPKEAGNKIAEGKIGPIPMNGTAIISFNAEKDGPYMFKLYQHPDFEETNKVKKEEWSEKVIVNCKAAKQGILEEQDVQEEINNVEIEHEQDINKNSEKLTKPTENNSQNSKEENPVQNNVVEEQGQKEDLTNNDSQSVTDTPIDDKTTDGTVNTKNEEFNSSSDNGESQIDKTEAGTNN